MEFIDRLHETGYGRLKPSFFCNILIGKHSPPRAAEFWAFADSIFEGRLCNDVDSSLRMHYDWSLHCKAENLWMNAESAGEHLAAARARSGISLKEMANRLGISSAYLCAAEHGRTRFTRTAQILDILESEESKRIARYGEHATPWFSPQHHSKLQKLIDVPYKNSRSSRSREPQKISQENSSWTERYISQSAANRKPDFQQR